MMEPFSDPSRRSSSSSLGSNSTSSERKESESQRRESLQRSSSRRSRGGSSRRLSTNSQEEVQSAPPSRYQYDATEETPLLPVFDLEDVNLSRMSGGGGSQLADQISDHDNSSDSHISRRLFFCTVSFLVIIIVLLGGYFFYSMQSLRTRTYHQHEMINALIKSQHKHVNDFDRRLNILENMTSNADVIEELHQTESRLEKHMEKEQKNVDTEIKDLRENVSKSLLRNEDAVNNKLSTVDYKLNDTKKHIKSMLMETEANMTKAIHSVTKELKNEKKSLEVLHANVTKQVSQLSTYMNSSIASINVVVASARKDIKTEVKKVYASMDQYIASTTAQFAAENDFVKYQLAGSFSILACLICLYHVTSHVRNFERPDVQRRVLAILWMVPIYSVTSWLQLVFPSSTNILSGIRDCYEAYVVYTFFAFLIAVLANKNVQMTQSSVGKAHNAVVNLLAKRIKEQREEETGHSFTSLHHNHIDVTANSTETNESQPSSPKRQLSHHKHSSIKPPCACLRCTSDSWCRPRNWCFLCKCCPSWMKCCRCCSSQTEADSQAEMESQTQRTPRDDLNSPRNVAASVLYQCSFLTLQFVLLKPILAAMPFFFWLVGVDYEQHAYYDVETGSVDWTSPKLYVLMIANLSVSFAFYGLLSFYHTTEKDLAWCDPWPKFLCIKGVVFMTFWQYVVLQMMSGMGLVDARAAGQIQNLLICIEMFMASIAHFYVFPYEEWGKNYEKEQKKIGLFRDTMALSDFVSDIGLMTKSKAYDEFYGGDDEEHDVVLHPERRGSSRRTSRLKALPSEQLQDLEKLKLAESEIHEVDTGHLQQQASPSHDEHSLQQDQKDRHAHDEDGLNEDQSGERAAAERDNDANQSAQKLMTDGDISDHRGVHSEDDFSRLASSPATPQVQPSQHDPPPQQLDPIISDSRLGAPRQSRDISQLLTSPSLSTPLKAAANDMHMQLAKHQAREGVREEDEEHEDSDISSMSSEDSFSPQQSSGDKPRGVSLSSVETFSSEPRSQGSRCDTDVDGYAGRRSVYISPARSLPLDSSAGSFSSLSAGPARYPSITAQHLQLRDVWRDSEPASGGSRSNSKSDNNDCVNNNKSSDHNKSSENNNNSSGGSAASGSGSTMRHSIGTSAIKSTPLVHLVKSVMRQSDSEEEITHSTKTPSARILDDSSVESV